MSHDEAMLALHRYFLQANQLRDRLDQRIQQEGVATYDSDAWPQQFVDRALWYACLYVVIEGWQELGLADGRIDSLLASANVDRLRRFRNATFHYQTDYMPEKMLELMLVGPESAVWLRDLNREFGRYLLTWLRRDRS